jgi:hypothetical protein
MSAALLAYCKFLFYMHGWKVVYVRASTPAADSAITTSKNCMYVPLMINGFVHSRSFLLAAAESTYEQRGMQP